MHLKKTLVAVGAALLLVGAGCSTTTQTGAPAAPAPAPAAPAAPADPQPSLSLAKTSFAAGETITVSYVALATYAANAWVGIIPSNVAHGSESVNDQHDVAYQYLNNTTSGQLTFTAPQQAGNYDFRMHNTDSDGVEVASVSFVVTAAAATA